MPSGLHEALVEMFRHQPALAAELLGVLGIALPAHQSARIEPTEFTDVSPTEYRADAVVVLTADDRPALAVVVEVQLSRDGDKRWSWPVYLATLRARLRCPAVLLVVCTDAAIAAWCAGPIVLGPGASMTAAVLGPDAVPVVDDPADAAAAPELAVLSVMAHGADLGRPEILGALHGVFSVVDEERAGRYYDLVLAALPAAAQRHLEELMATPTYEYQSDFARRYFFQGKAEGKAEGTAVGKAEGTAAGAAAAVLAVLDARGIEVPAAVRTRITSCTDLDQLDAWVRRAVTAAAADDVFG